MEFCYKKNQRMNDILICCGYSYNLKSASNAVNPPTKEAMTKRWKCSVRYCYATLTVENNNKIIKINGKNSELNVENLLTAHNHDSKSKNQLIAQETLSNLKSKLIENASVKKKNHFIKLKIKKNR